MGLEGKKKQITYNNVLSNFVKLRQKKAIRDGQPVKFVGSGGWNRTNGLQVMSLTSYLCSTPQYCVSNTISLFPRNAS